MPLFTVVVVFMHPATSARLVYLVSVKQMFKDYFWLFVSRSAS